MKQVGFFIFFMFAVLCYSCGSKNISEPVTVQSKLQRHTWLVDSIKLTAGGSTSTMYIGNNIELPLTFEANTFSSSFFLSTTNTTYNYLVKEPDTIYFWLPDEQLNEDQYFIINKIDNKG